MSLFFAVEIVLVNVLVILSSQNDPNGSKNYFLGRNSSKVEVKMHTEKIQKHKSKIKWIWCKTGYKSDFYSGHQIRYFKRQKYLIK